MCAGPILLEIARFARVAGAGFTQRELSIAVGYSIPQISRLEQNQRLAAGANVAGNGRGIAIVWDVSTGQELLTLSGHTETVWTVV